MKKQPLSSNLSRQNTNSKIRTSHLKTTKSTEESIENKINQDDPNSIAYEKLISKMFNYLKEKVSPEIYDELKTIISEELKSELVTSTNVKDAIHLLTKNSRNLKGEILNLEKGEINEDLHLNEKDYPKSNYNQGITHTSTNHSTINNKNLKLSFDLMNSTYSKSLRNDKIKNPSNPTNITIEEEKLKTNNNSKIIIPNKKINNNNLNIKDLKGFSNLQNKMIETKKNLETKVNKNLYTSNKLMNISKINKISSHPINSKLNIISKTQTNSVSKSKSKSKEIGIGIGSNRSIYNSLSKSKSKSKSKFSIPNKNIIPKNNIQINLKNKNNNSVTNNSLTNNYLTNNILIQNQPQLKSNLKLNANLLKKMSISPENIRTNYYSNKINTKLNSKIENPLIKNKLNNYTQNNLIQNKKIMDLTYNINLNKKEKLTTTKFIDLNKNLNTENNLIIKGENKNENSNSQIIKEIKLNLDDNMKNMFNFSYENFHQENSESGFSTKKSDELSDSEIPVKHFGKKELNFTNEISFDENEEKLKNNFFKNK